MYPLIMILKGLKLFYKDLNLVTFPIVGVVIFFLNSYYLEIIEHGNDTIKGSFYFIVLGFVICLIIFNSVFTTPGSLFRSGIENSDINCVIKELKKIDPNKNVLTKIRDNVLLSYQRYNSRFIFLRTIFALLWAFNTYLFTFNNSELNNIFSTFGLTINIYFIILLFFCLLELYKKCGDFIYKCTFYALNEYEILIDKESFYYKKYERPYDLPL